MLTHDGKSGSERAFKTCSLAVMKELGGTPPWRWTAQDGAAPMPGRLTSLDVHGRWNYVPPSGKQNYAELVAAGRLHATIPNTCLQMQTIRGVCKLGMEPRCVSLASTCQDIWGHDVAVVLFGVRAGLCVVCNRRQHAECAARVCSGCRLGCHGHC